MPARESTTAPASAANSRRVMVMFISASLGGAGLDQRRAVFLRPSQSRRQDEPGGRYGPGDERDRSEFQAERLQAVEDPSIQRIGAAIDHHIDEVLCLVLLFTPENGEEHLPRRIGDGEV